MKTIGIILTFIVCGVFLSGCSSNIRNGKPRVLVFTKTEGFHHASIPDGVKAILKLGKENGFLVDTTSNANKFTDDSLKQYSAVIFLSTTGNVLNARQQDDFERYIQAGGGYIGIHAATDCEYHWPWYGKLVGAYFDEHPRPQKAKLVIHKDPNFPVTDSLPNPWIRKDEWYNFRKPPENVHVLVSIDEKSYEGGTNGANHPMVWYHNYDGGRAFYMELGHTPESYSEQYFLDLLEAGIQYGIGKNRKLDYAKATTLRKPAEDRFKKVLLAGGLDEPTELTVLPNLNILVAEWRGNIKFYNADDHTIKKVAHLKVYNKAIHRKNVNVENGLLGLQADPNFNENHWIYVYYSPIDTSVDRLSRFKFQNGNFDLKSEQVILEVHTDREVCCHTGGSIAFGPKGNLFLSVGDNTTPFDEIDPGTGKPYPINTHGFAPLDDRPGFEHEHYDDRRSAGNTNDLRGKILRIHVNADGSYSIPKGNLFFKGTPKTRPEIYVMGDRNPYRISVDQHTGYLYWGEVGPDANHDSLATRGPRGYDEINQARKAGNFGWPYFIGKNYPYHEYNYATGKSGPAFNPNHLVNNSRNNTGLKILPSPQPAFIWYPYAKSPDFPILGTGGRTAMAGPVYYVKDYRKDTRYPEYYNKKLFIYDWIRNWIMAVTMDSAGNLKTIEPFMPHTRFFNISDMETGPDGRLYIVEYGKGWFTKNPKSALSVITYNGGNRPPVVKLDVDKEAGSLPLKVHLSAQGSMDPDKDKLKYIWHIDKGLKKQTNTPEFNYTFNKPGIHYVSLTVVDSHGGKTNGRRIRLVAGNNRPKIDIQLTGNTTFYFPNKPVSYKITVNDKEDGNSNQPGFNLSKIFVNATYLMSAKDTIDYSDQAKITASIPQGEKLMESLDCKSCHNINGTSIGPSFYSVANRYKKDKKRKAVDFLSHKIIKGGSGNWGSRAMAAHPNLSLNDASSIVNWILSLEEDDKKNHKMPLNGTFLPSEFKLTPKGVIMLSCSYQDNGSNGAVPLNGLKRVVLQNPLLSSKVALASENISGLSFGGKYLKFLNSDSGWIEFPKISLNGVSKVKINYALTQVSPKGWEVTALIDNRQVGHSIIGKGKNARKPLEDNLTFNKEIDDNKLQDLYFVFHRLNKKGQGGIAISGILLQAK